MKTKSALANQLPVIDGTWDAESLKDWKNRSTWTLREFQDLTCGLVPVERRPQTEEMNVACDAIGRAVIAKELIPIDPVDTQGAERFYDQHRHFKPLDAIRWVAGKGRFPKFPFTIADVAQGSEQPADAVKGEIVALPYLTDRLNAVFGVMRENAVRLLSDDPPKQNVIALEIETAIASLDSKTVDPSAERGREATAYAALIRPNSHRANDRRVPRRNGDKTS
jgi:hypothetical protein